MKSIRALAASCGLFATLVLLACSGQSPIQTASHENRAVASPTSTSTVVLRRGVNRPLLPAMAIQDRYTDALTRIRGVVGTATSVGLDGKPVIRIYTEKAGVQGLPAALEGVPVQIEVSGPFVARDVYVDRYARPVPIGVSVGPAPEYVDYWCIAGTNAARITDGAGSVFSLSNNHVYANENGAPQDTPILQPGPYDNCVLGANDQIGALFDFEPIVFKRKANNRIDAAVASTTTAAHGNSAVTSYQDGSSTPRSDPVGAFVGQNVQKIGRTTGYTAGVVDALNATVLVGYDSGTARFVGQLVVTPGSFSDSGDSGSLIVDSERHPVGLLFAGGTDHTVANAIDDVLAWLRSSLGPGAAIDGEGAEPQCTVDGDCNDNDLCTTDSCDQATGTCRFEAVTCTAPDACHTSACDPATGQCVDTAIDCDDGLDCSVDTCDPVSGCQHDYSACPPCAGEGEACSSHADCCEGLKCKGSRTGKHCS